MTSAVISVSDERHRRQLDKLRRELGPVVLRYLAEDSVVEVMLNDDGRIWVEKAGEPMFVAGEMAATQAQAAIETIAAYYDRIATIERPLVECVLPLDGSRFTGVLPPIVSKPSFTIRRHSPSTFTIEDYVTRGIMNARQAALIDEAVAARKNIIVTGGTGSGKTTLLNTVMELAVRRHPELRRVIIEDTRELRRIADNCVMLQTSTNVSLTDLLKTTLRYRPDCICVGEVRDGAAHGMLKLWNTGHDGGSCSIHSNNSVRGALIRLEQRVLEVVERPIPGFIAEAVDVIVGIERFEAGRRITSVVGVEGYKDHDFVVRNLETGELV